MAGLAAGLDPSTGRLTSPERFSLQLEGREVGTTILAVGAPVRVVKREAGMLLVRSAVGSAWVREASVSLTGEDLAFEKQELIEAISGSTDLATGATAARAMRLRARRIPPVPSLPTGKEDNRSSAPEAEKAVLAIVNKERRKHGLAALQWDPDLARAARFHAAHMANHRYFDHDTFLPGKGKVMDCFVRIQKFSPSCCSENIAFGNPTATEVMRSWMDSPGHRENILRKSARKLGVGCVGGYWVQDFGG